MFDEVKHISKCYGTVSWRKACVDAGEQKKAESASGDACGHQNAAVGPLNVYVHLRNYLIN